MRDLIASAVGADCLLDVSAFAHYAVRGRRPAAVAAPHDAQQAAAVLHFASREGIAVECVGSGSRLNGGNHGHQPFIALSSARINTVAEYEPADLVISIGAGVTHPRLRAAVSPHNQFFALDPAVSPESTVGATIATGTAGPLRYAHGTPRDQVLGLEIVTGDGRILNFGGKVVKNVAGYDVVRLIVGSRGTLGLITRINLRLKPVPQVDRTLAIAGDTSGDVVDLVDAIRSTTLEPVALEVISPALAGRVVGVTAWTLLVRFNGNDAGIASADERTRALAGNATTMVQAESVWTQLAQAEMAALVTLRFANVQSRLRETILAALRASAAVSNDSAEVAVHAGDGIARVFVSNPSAHAVALLTQERATITAEGGTLIVERSAPDMTFDAFGKPEGMALMNGIKKVFDPAGILAPARFVL